MSRRNKYNQNRNIPEFAKQDIVLGVRLEDITWIGKKTTSRNNLKMDELKITISGNRAYVSIYSTCLGIKDKVSYSVIGDKILFRKGECGYAVTKQTSENLFKVYLSYNDLFKGFENKIYPIHKYNEDIFFITKSEGGVIK